MAQYTKADLDSVEKAVYAGLKSWWLNLELEVDNVFEQDGKIIIVLTKADVT